MTHWNRLASPAIGLILAISVCLGCGIPSQRMSLEDTVDAIDSAPAEPSSGEVAAVPGRQPWRSSDPADESGESRGDIALTAAEEPVGSQLDPDADTARAAAPRSASASAVPARHASGTGTVETVSGDDFDSVVLSSDKPVLVDFYADSCGPCRKLAPVLDALAADTPDVKVVKVNVDRSPKLAKIYRVNAWPTLLLFKHGQLVSRHQGLASRKTLEELVAK